MLRLGAALASAPLTPRPRRAWDNGVVGGRLRGPGVGLGFLSVNGPLSCQRMGVRVSLCPPHPPPRERPPSERRGDKNLHRGLSLLGEQSAIQAFALQLSSAAWDPMAHPRGWMWGEG